MIRVVVNLTPQQVAEALSAEARRRLPEFANAKASVNFDRRKGATITFEVQDETGDDAGTRDAAAANPGAAGVAPSN